MPSSDNGFYAPGGMEWSDAYEADAIEKGQAPGDAKCQRCGKPWSGVGHPPWCRDCFASATEGGGA